MHPEVFDVDIGVDLLEHQIVYLESLLAVCGLIAGVGSGKTYVGAYGAYEATLTLPSESVAMGAPSFPMLRKGAIKTYARHHAEWGFDFRYYPSKRLIEFITPTASGKKIRTYAAALSFEDPDSNRGDNLAYIWLDEPAIMKREALEVALARLRVTEHPRLRMTGTPAGFNWVYQFLVGDLDEAASKDPARFNRLAMQRQIIQGIHSHANFFNPGSFLENLEISYDPATYEQEVKGEFVELGQGRVFHEFDRKRHVVKDGRFDYVPGLPVLYSTDFNILGSATLWQWDGDISWCFDEIQIPKSNTWEVCLETIKRWNTEQPDKRKVKKWIIAGDATGTHGTANSQWNNWQIVREIFRDKKWDGKDVKGDWEFQDETWSTNPAVKDTVTLCNNRFHRNKIFINDRCRLTIRDFAQMTFKEGTQDINKKKDSKLTHLGDTARYAQKAIYFHDPLTPAIY